MVDLVRPLKLEDPASGGSTLDNFPNPVETDPSQDYTAAKGLAIEDSTTLIDKDPTALQIRFIDNVNGSVLLGDILAFSMIQGVL